MTEVVAALESSLYPQASTSFSQEDLVDEWSSLDLQRNTHVVRDGDRVVGYGAVRDKGELWRAEGYVHPAAHGRGIGKLLATTFERDAAAGGARRIQNGVYEPDAAACRLLQSIGYRAVRVFREMRIELAAPPPIPTWPEGLRAATFDPERDALAFHAAQRKRLRMRGSTPRATLSPGRGPTWRVSGSTQPCGASSEQETRSPRERSALPTRTAAASSRSCSRVARGAGTASAQRSSRTRSAGFGSVASVASGWASTRRATLERSASTSAPE